MPRPRIGVIALTLAPLVVPAFESSAANIASPSVNREARAVVTTSSGPVSSVNNLNNGEAGGNAGVPVYLVPTQIQGAQTRPGSRGLGYDLGGIATIESLDLSQVVTGSSRGQRARLQNVVVHTAAGSFPYTLPNQDDVTILFGTPTTTSWVTIETVSQHDGDDPAIGIDELAVNSAAGVVGPRRTNVAAGRPVTFAGTGWSGTANLTDNLLGSATSDPATSRVFLGAPTAVPHLDIDLGASQSVNALGLAESDYGTNGGRRLAQNVQLLFSDDAAFTNINATRDLVLDNIPYQQEEFAAASGRYVRVSVLTRFANRDESFGVTEVQLFAVPEPTMLGLIAPAVVMLMRRRR